MDHDSRSRGHPKLLRILSEEPVDWSAFLSALSTPKGRDEARILIRTAVERPLGWLLRGRPPPSVVLSLLDSHRSDILDPRNEGLAGLTPLHQACLTSSPVDVVRTVLAADPTAASRPSRNGSPPLFFAADVDTARLLMESSPGSVSMANLGGWTPLHVCADDADRGADLARLLVGGGGNLGSVDGGALTPNADGRTPLDVVCATVGGRHSREFPPEPLREEHRGEWSKLLVLLRAAHGGAPAPREGAGDGGRWRPPFWPLHAALELRCPPVVIWHVLQQEPEHVSQRDNLGRLPLHLAAAALPRSSRKGEAGGGWPYKAWDDSTGTVVRWLLDAYPAGAGYADRDGRLPLHNACTRGGIGWDEGMRELVRAEPRALGARDPWTGLPPFALAATSGGCHSVSTICALIKEDPSVLQRFCA